MSQGLGLLVWLVMATARLRGDAMKDVRMRESELLSNAVWMPMSSNARTITENK